MDPMTIALIGSAVLGYMKSQEQQGQYKDAKKEAARNRKTEATREKWAPFTGRRGQTVNDPMRPSQIDPMMQSMITGAMLGQQFQGGGGAAAAAPQGTTGAVSPMGGSGAYTATPAAGAIQNGSFDAYAQNQYFRPYG